MTLTQPPSELLQLVNQVFDMDRKLSKSEDSAGLERNVRRMKAALEGMGLSWHDPTGEVYRETRTDCEASISGNEVENLRITEVIKPIIRMNIAGSLQIVQRAVVIVSAN